MRSEIFAYDIRQEGRPPFCPLCRNLMEFDKSANGWTCQHYLMKDIGIKQ